MGSAPKTPAAPNPIATANTQSQMNKDAALYSAALNNVNQITPYGNLTYTRDDAAQKAQFDQAMAAWKLLPAKGNGYAPKLTDFAPQYTSTINLSPDQQQILDSQEDLEKQAQGIAGTALTQYGQNQATPYSLAGLSHQLANPNDVSNQESSVTQMLLSRLQPQFQRDQAALDTKLANQGIVQGSEAYNNAIGLQNQAKNDAYTQAALSGVQAGQIYNNEALANNQQDVSNYNQQYYAPLNAYNSLTGGVQVQNPQFSGPQSNNVQAPDFMGATNQAYQNALNQANAKTAGNNSTMGGLFGLGGSFLGAGGAAGGFGKLFGGLF